MKQLKRIIVAAAATATVVLVCVLCNYLLSNSEALPTKTLPGALSRSSSMISNALISAEDTLAVYADADTAVSAEDDAAVPAEDSPEPSPTLSSLVRAAEAIDESQEGESYTSGELLLTFDSSLGESGIREALEACSTLSADSVVFLSDNTALVATSAGVSVAQAAQQISSGLVSGVEALQPNYRYELLENDEDDTLTTRNEIDALTAIDEENTLESDDAAHAPITNNGENTPIQNDKPEALAENVEEEAATTNDESEAFEADDKVEAFEAGEQSLSAQALSINDPQSAKQWHLESVGIYDAWELARCDGRVSVAVIDTGCDLDHPDLKNNIVASYNSVVSTESPSNTKDASDTQGHGTHVAGIIAAQTNNNIGVSGVSYNAGLLPIKVYASDDTISSSSLVRAYEYLLEDAPYDIDANGSIETVAEEYKVRVVNMSIGAVGQYYPDNELLQRVNEAYAAGILTVCAAGNVKRGDNPEDDEAPFACWPGDFENCVNVVNLTSNDTLSSSSNYNVPGSTTKNISAPGSSIWSTIKGGSYGSKTGTSMASPVVAGIAALVMSTNESITAEQCATILYETATDLGAAGWDESYGYGKINADAALQYALYREPILPAYCTLTGVDNETYNGLTHEGTVSVAIEGTPLVEGKDYKVSYENNVNAGQATAKVIGLGLYGGVATLPFTIAPASLDSATILTIPKQTYTGYSLEPTVTVKHPAANASKGGLLEKNVDYYVSYSNNQEVGLANVKIWGFGNYRGTKNTSFTIVRPNTTVKRLAGIDAVATSTKISAESFPDGSDWVILACNDHFADAMSATGLAGVLKCPIVLTTRTSLSSTAAAEIKRLGAKNCYIIGGPATLSNTLEGQLKALGLRSVERLWGNCSWDTSIACAKKISSLGGNPRKAAIVTTSQTFQDALSISSFAYKYSVPIYLQTAGSAGQGLPAAAISDIKKLSGTIYVPGGSMAVPVSTVEGVFGTGRVVRMWGNDGYDTSNQIASYMVRNGLLSAHCVCVASGAQAANGTDALAGSVLAGKRGGVMLLANSNTAFEPLRLVTLKGKDSRGTPAFLSAKASEVYSAYILGGTAVAPKTLEDQIKALL